MLSTNLLPSEAKKEIWFEQAYRISLFFGAAIVFVFIFASALLLPSYLPIILTRSVFENRLEIEEAASSRMKVQEKIDQAKTVRGEIALLRDRLIKPVNIGVVLDQFLMEPGNGISVQSVDIRKNGRVGIRGMALTREDLLLFEKKIRDGGKFENISSPLSNIIRGLDINFVFEGALKSPYKL